MVPRATQALLQLWLWPSHLPPPTRGNLSHSPMMCSNRSAPCSTLTPALHHQSSRQPCSHLLRAFDHHPLLTDNLKQASNLQWQLSTLLAGHHLTCTEIQYHYGGCAEPPTRSTSTTAHQKPKRIAETSHTLDSSMDRSSKRPRKERSCTY